MKYIFSSIFILFITMGASAQATKIDTSALTILDQMSYIIGDLSSVSFTLNTRKDVRDSEVGVMSRFGVSKLYFDGPSRMMVNTTGGKGHRGFWYNGNFFVYYSYDENNFAVIDAPSTTIATIDSLHATFGIEFPAADFFYPTFTQDLIDFSSEIRYNGLIDVNNKECFHIIAKQNNMTIQFWIENSAMYLPIKMIIMDNSDNNCIQYEATFNDWKINPELPDAMFDFLPPPGAHEVFIQSK